MGSSQGLAWGLEAMGTEAPGVLKTAREAQGERRDLGGRHTSGSGS